MRRLLTCVLFGGFLISAICPAPEVFAQDHEAAHRQKAAEFTRLWERLQQIQDAEEWIVLAEQTLKIERDLRQWPLSLAREEVRRRLWARLGVVYTRRQGGDRAENIERAIAAYKQALQEHARERSTNVWASLQNALATAYADRVRGELADNLEKAIAGHEAALTVFTREAFPEHWAHTQTNLGIAYRSRIRGEPAENVERAIAHYEAALTVTARENSPAEWGTIQNNVANAYFSRIRGDRADNLEKAIARYEASLLVTTREAFPREWAQTQHNLAEAHRSRVRGDRADNLEKAIAFYEAALTIRTVHTSAKEWATTQNGLGSAYGRRIRGQHADNLEKAIAHYEAALTVRTRDAFPQLWADSHNDLAIAYQNRVRGDRANNLEKAIGYLETALMVRTREAMPLGWADIQNNLAIAYWDRIHGDRADNVEKAIAAYEAALTVATRQAYPRQWAETQHNLAIAYRTRVRGERAENLTKAIVAYQAALTFRTLEALPREHLATARFLGEALLEAGEWRTAGLAYASAREAFLLLFGQGLNDAEARDLIAQAGPLFAEAAFAAVHGGEREAALKLVSEGRARMMAVALMLQANNRQRVVELRRAIRERSRIYETTTGPERTASLDRLVVLRGELLDLLKSASVAEEGHGLALAHARAAAAPGGAAVVPIVTKVGAKILIVTGAANDPTVLDLPKLTTARLNKLLFGDGKAGGWLRAYSINYLQGTELNQRWPEWLAAVSNLGPELWGTFAAQIDGALKQQRVKRGSRLIWLPTGALGILPLGIAQDPATKRRLADDYEIIYAPSLEALAVAQQQIANPTSTTLAAIINPTGDLPGAEKEGKVVASHFPAKGRTVLERSAATPDAVLAALKGKSHWHFASHGTFSWQDARRSALVMHNQAHLSVGQLLDTDGLGRPRLVVLSACETGLYDIRSNPDEFIGLPGAFTALGAAGVLGTLWPVSDAATAMLIARFYELHMVQGFPPPKALSLAQTWLRQATNADLAAYAKLSAKQGRLDSRHVAEIEQELSEDGLNRSRNREVTEWIEPSTAPADEKKSTSSVAKPVARPYAHPYFWAGFIHTGM